MDAGDYRKSADVLGGILDDATRRSHFEDICREAVEYELRQFSAAESNLSSGLYGFLLKRMAKAASDYALPSKIDPRDFQENALNDGLGIVRSLRFAFTRYGSDSSSQTFWDNNANPLEK